MAPKELPKAYDASAVEQDIFKQWEKSGAFDPDKLAKLDKRYEGADPYCIVLPPPNRTGTLHLGHAKMLAIEDLLIRFHRMLGKKTYWIPGTDHAALATQVKVEQILVKEGIKNPRKDLGREKLLERINVFVQQSRDTIVEQCKRMGSSMDWSREKYTLDEDRNKAVNKVFEMMFEDGLIERGFRVVNWDPVFQTTLSDDEVEHKDTQAELVTFTYDKDFPIAISTTRPETKFGDTGVAVHPDDKRYKKFVGKTLTAVFCKKQITLKVIADAEVDPKFGTGALGVTPAHSLIDADLAERHGLPMVQVIGQDGKMTNEAGEDFAGLTTIEARKKIIKTLEEQGCIQKKETVPQSLLIAQRGESPVEQLPMRQWFVRVNKKFKLRNDTLDKWKKGDEATLKELMRYAVESKQTKILPENFEKIYFHWIDNLRDWCISRQIWFGHQIPVYYRQTPNVKRQTPEDVILSEVEEPALSERRISASRMGSGLDMVVSSESPGKGWMRDPDTLDTWFSSGLWTFSTLGWPDVETRVTASRHGATDLHGGGRYIGQAKETDLGLSLEGKKQAEALAQKLKDEKFDVIISSPLKRARETAEAVNQFHDLPIIEDERLLEREFGFMNGKTHAELLKDYPDLPPWVDVGLEDQYKDEERPVEVLDRVKSFLDEIQQKYQGKHVYVVTSGGILDFFQMVLKKKTFQQIKTISHQKAGIENYTLRSSKELAMYHPTNVLETGYDILFFWVARMILMSTYVLGEVPFKDVYLHGLVRDEKGRKMSKSIGNVLDPLDLIPKYGTDAVRLSLVMGTSPGMDQKLSEDKIKDYRNFTNKLWNISRFIIQSSDGLGKKELDRQWDLPKTLADRWILSRFYLVQNRVTKLIEDYQFSQAGELLRDFAWGEFADWYLEVSKIEKEKAGILLHILTRLVKLWHPLMPFVTEYIWDFIGFEHQLIISEWPTGEYEDQEAIRDFELVKSLITDIRRLRAEQGVEPGAFIKVAMVADKSAQKLIDENIAIVKQLARLEEIEFVNAVEKDWPSAVSGKVTIGLNLASGIDVEKEREKIQKEIEALKPYIKSTEAKLKNKDFTSKAPEKVVNDMKNKLDEAKAKLVALEKRLG